MTVINLQYLTPKQRQAWQMRYRYGWRIRKIALAMGTQKQTVTELLQRAHVKAGVPKKLRVRMIRTKPRFARSQSLATVYDV